MTRCGPSSSAEVVAEPGDEEIYADSVVHAMKALHDAHGYTIHDAIDAVSDRYPLLRREPRNGSR